MRSLMHDIYLVFIYIIKKKIYKFQSQWNILKNKLKITLKQLRKKYCSKKSQEIIVENKLEFYKKIKTIGIDKIISIDESAFYLNMTRNFE